MRTFNIVKVLALLAVCAFAAPTTVNSAANQAHETGQLQALGQPGSLGAQSTEVDRLAPKTAKGLPPIRCLACSMTSNRWSEFLDHHKVAHRGKKFHVTYDAKVLDATLSWTPKTPEDRPPVHCLACQQYLNSWPEFESHHRRAHRGHNYHATYDHKNRMDSLYRTKDAGYEYMLRKNP